jgi:hypothetical protein
MEIVFDNVFFFHTWSTFIHKVVFIFQMLGPVKKDQNIVMDFQVECSKVITTIWMINYYII